MNVFDLSAKITMDINGYLKGMETSKAVALSTMGAIGGAVSQFMQESIETGKGFDTSMSQVAATMGTTMQGLTTEVGAVDTAFGAFSGNLREYAQFMGQHTAFSATQAGEALNYMALAGYDAQRSMEMLPNVLNLAAAGSMDLARASNMVTDSQTAFGLSGARTTQMVDEMAKAASTGNTSVEQLGEAFLTVGGLAKELNGGMVTLADGTQAETDGVQELEIALTAMANAGVKGSEAGTHMRNMLLKLSSPTEEGAKQMEALGVNVFDAEGKMRSLQDIMGDLNGSLSKLTQEEKIKAISELFNTRDMASAEALLAAVGEDWNKIGEEILNAEGAAQQMADVQLDNLEGDITLFNSALEGLQIALSDSATPALRALTQFGTEAITDLTEVFQDLPEPVQEAIGVIGLFGGKAVEIAPQVIGLGSNLSILAANCPQVGMAFSKMAGVLANPIFIGVAAAIGIAVAAFMQIKHNIDENTEAIRALREEADALDVSVDDASDSITKLSEEELNSADAADNLAKAQANLEALQKAQEEATGRNKDAVDAYSEAVENAGDSMFESGTDIISMIVNVGTAYGTAQEAQEGFTESVEKFDEVQQKADEEMIAATNQVAAYTLLASEMTEAEAAAAAEVLNMLDVRETSVEAYQNVCDAITDLNTAHDEEVAKTEETIATIQTQMEELQATYDAAYDSAYNSISQTMGLFGTVTVEVNQSVTDMIDALDSQLSFMDTYAENMAKASELGIDKGLLQHLSDGSTESAAILQSIVDDGGAHIQELNEKFAGVEEGKQSFATAMAELNTDFTENMNSLQDQMDEAMEHLNQADEAYAAGVQTIIGAINGANEQGGNLEITYANLAIRATNAYKRNLQIHSPSRIFEGFGENTIEAAIGGAEKKRRNLEEAYGNLADAAADAYGDNTVATVGEVGWKKAGSLAASIPRSDSRNRPQTVNLVLDEQVIGRVLLPLLEAENQRVGIQIGGFA